MPSFFFFHGKNTDLLPLYEKHKKKDDVNDSLNIQCTNGIWSIHSINCTGEQVNNRSCLHPDKKKHMKIVSTVNILKMFVFVLGGCQKFYVLRIT